MARRGSERRFLRAALMEKSMDCPKGAQRVPAAILCTTDQAPLAQRWKAVPSRQFHSPSSEQGPVRPLGRGPEEGAAVAVPLPAAEPIPEPMARLVAPLPALVGLATTEVIIVELPAAAVA